MKTRFNPFSHLHQLQEIRQTPAVDAAMNAAGTMVRTSTRPAKTKGKGKVARPARTRPERSVLAQRALERAQNERSLANYPAIIEAFTRRGIPAHQIIPRENVLTFHAWLAKGRSVRKGEKGVPIATVIPVGKETIDPETGEPRIRTRPGRAFVFHISQTDPVEKKQAKPAVTTHPIKVDFKPQPKPAPVKPKIVTPQLPPPLPMSAYTKPPTPTVTVAASTWRHLLKPKAA